MLLVVLACSESPAPAVNDGSGYQVITQAELIRDRDSFVGKKVQVKGDFLFTGSDFCFQIRKTKINTKDYFCFALGTPSLIRFYLKKDHEQVEEILNMKKGAELTAFGTFDSSGTDFNYLLVDKITEGPSG